MAGLPIALAVFGLIFAIKDERDAVDRGHFRGLWRQLAGGTQQYRPDRFSEALPEWIRRSAGGRNLPGGSARLWLMARRDY